MKAFIGLRIYTEDLCIKPSYWDYWSSEGPKFLGVVDEQNVSIDKTDTKTEYWHSRQQTYFLQSLQVSSKSNHCYICYEQFSNM